MHKLKVAFKKCHPDAKIPTQKLGDVGFDLCSVEDIYISPHAVTKVKTGLIFGGHDEGIPLINFTAFAKIEGRSGMASKGVFPVGGIVDPSYRGEIVVALANVASIPYRVEAGNRIAQLVFYPCVALPDVELIEVTDVDQTERSDSGFGSSGQ